MKAISNENMQKSISGLEGKVLASGYTLFESLLLILLLTTILSFPVLAFSAWKNDCLLYTSPSPRDVEESRMPSSA